MEKEMYGKFLKEGSLSFKSLNKLFLQGMEHRNWLEENKIAVKFAFDKPGGKRIHVRKRVKLVLGFCGDKIPDLFTPGVPGNLS